MVLERSERRATSVTQWGRLPAVLLAGFAWMPVEAYETAITDTTGYVVLSATDNPGVSSLINGNNFPGGAPVAGMDYLVNAGRTIRTPESGSPFVFKGNSLTLDGGATLALKCPGSTTTINDLRIYNARIGQADGNSVKTLTGNMTVFGTPTAPATFEGSGDNGDRIIDLNATVRGANGTCVRVVHAAAADKKGCEFFVRIGRGNASTYSGIFEVEGANASVVAEDMGVFGSSYSVTLRNGGGLVGQGHTGMAINGRTVTIDNGGRMGAFQKNGTAITFDGGSTITGTGKLLIYNPKMGSTWKGPVAMNDVTVSGLDGIVVSNDSVLAVGTGYKGAAIPIAVKAGGTLRGDGAAQTGPVTLDEGGILDFTLSPGVLTINGALVTTAADGKIHVDIAPQDVTKIVATNVCRLMTAANLGTAGATLDDFVLTTSGAPESIRAAVTNGTFSIEAEDGTNYLVYTLPRKFVYFQGTDAGGSGAGGSSFQTTGRWSDKALPHSDADYFVLNSSVLRALDGSPSTFNGHSLSIMSGGTFHAQGATATVADLRLYGGCCVSATRSKNNAIAGNISVHGSASNPVFLRIEVNKSPGEPIRPLTLLAPVSGSGSVRFVYAPGHVNDSYTPDPAYPGVFNLRGDNSGFTGEWQLWHFAIQGTFTSAANVGSASAIVFNSNAVFRAQDASFAIPAATRIAVDTKGSNAADTLRTNGGSFLVDDGLTLTVNGPVSGSGILRKIGAGTLRLTAAANAYSGTASSQAGTMLVDGALTNASANAKSGAFIGGVGKVKSLTMEDGSGFAIATGQATPLEAGTLTVAGSVVVRLDSASDFSAGRVALAKVGTLAGTLTKANRATICAGSQTIANGTLTISNGILYAAQGSTVILVR